MMACADRIFDGTSRSSRLALRKPRRSCQTQPCAASALIERGHPECVSCKVAPRSERVLRVNGGAKSGHAAAQNQARWQGDLLLDRAIALVLKVMSLAAQEPYAGACDRQGDNRDDEFKEGQYSPQKSLQREHSRLSNRRHH